MSELEGSLDTIEELLASLEAHRTHCVGAMEKTKHQASVFEANRDAWREEIRTLDMLIPGLVLLSEKVNEVINYLTEAEKKLKVGEQGLAPLPEVL